jgi:hypothetical protein
MSGAGQFNPPAYYRPYTSDDEDDDIASQGSTDSDTNTDTTGSSGSEEGNRDYASDAFADTIAKGLDDPRYAIIRAAGPSFNTVHQQFDYEKPGPRGRQIIGAEYIQPPIDSLSNSPLYLNPKKRIQSTLFSFKSENRDKNVFPLSSFFTLKTPRTYKNVTQIQLVQVNFQYFVNAVPDLSGIAELLKSILSTAGYDISDCAACLPQTLSFTGGGFQEIGRTNPANPSQPLTTTFELRPGNYDVNGLVYEMDQQMNKTPPFNLITYTEHYNLFKATKTVDHLFNEPGRYYYKKLTGVFVRSPTKAQIVADYFPHTDILNASAPTDQEIFVAYFYPVLREAFLSPLDHKFLDLLTYSEQEVRNRVLHTYEGLSSTFYYDLCKENVSYLKTLRRQHTFEYAPINQYDWEHNPYTRKNMVRHTELHPSLKTELANRHTLHKQQAILNRGLTLAQFQTLETQLQQTKAVVTGLLDHMNKALVEVGVPYGAYDAAFLNAVGNAISTTNKAALTSSQLGAGDDLLLGIATGTVAPPTATAAPRVIPYTFGEMTLTNLKTESAAIALNPADPNYNAPWAQHLSSLNGYSVASRVGSNLLASYGGATVAATDFPSLHSTFQSYYAQNVSMGAVVSAVTADQYVASSNYVHTKYGSVFPPQLLANNGFLTGLGTGGVKWLTSQRVTRASTPFDSPTATTSPCCQALGRIADSIYSCIPAQYVISSAFYKLGLSGFDVIAYYSTAGLFGSLTTQNLYLQLNVEKQLNNMDVAGKEEYRISNETAGEHHVVLGKLLTEGSGLSDITQTIVQSPAKFDTPLASIDQFTFTLLLSDLEPVAQAFPFDITGTDWDAVIQVDEEVGTLDRETQLSSVPTVAWPDAKRPF